MRLESAVSGPRRKIESNRNIFYSGTGYASKVLITAYNTICIFIYKFLFSAYHDEYERLFLLFVNVGAAQLDKRFVFKYVLAHRL